MATTCGVLRLDKSFHNLSSYVLDEGAVLISFLFLANKLNLLLEQYSSSGLYLFDNYVSPNWISSFVYKPM